MQPEPIILIPPTHEQSVSSFHVEESLVPRFLEFLASKGITPWRPLVALEKDGPDGEQVIQIDVESASSQPKLEGFIAEFLQDNSVTSV